MSPLTSKERVLIALRHEVPDRVPIDFGARHSIHVSAHLALKRHLGLDDGADAVRLAAAQTVAEIERHPFPDPADPHRLAGILQPIQIASAARDKAILLNAQTVGIWWLAFSLRGLEQAMVDLGLQPELTEVSGAADATPASSNTGRPPRCGMKFGAAWRTWRPGAASSSAPSTTSRSTCLRRTSWPCSTRRETRAATAAAGPSPNPFATIPRGSAAAPITPNASETAQC